MFKTTGYLWSNEITLGKLFLRQQHSRTIPFEGDRRPSNTPINLEEAQFAIKKLNNNRAAGSDEIAAELVKYAPEELNKTTQKILVECFEQHELLYVGKRTLVPLQKPGKLKGSLKNLSSLILLLIIRKILSNIKIQRMIAHIAHYSTLRTLKKSKRLTPFHVRKMLAESTILSRINYGIVFYKNAYLIKRIQRVRNAAAGCVLMRYSSEKDVMSLNWLPVIELTDIEISKLAYKALSDEPWLNYLSFNWKKFIRDLRNNDSNMIERSKENQTFMIMLPNSQQTPIKY